MPSILVCFEASINQCPFHSLILMHMYSGSRYWYRLAYISQIIVRFFSARLHIFKLRMCTEIYHPSFAFRRRTHRRTTVTSTSESTIPAIVLLGNIRALF